MHDYKFYEKLLDKHGHIILKNTGIENANDFALFLLEEAHVATVTGEAFGNSDCIRISYAASEEEIKTAVERIKNALS